jgi:hypothetical protein
MRQDRDQLFSPDGSVLDEIVVEREDVLPLNERVIYIEERLVVAERPEHVLEWQPPTGAHDAPNIGDHRWYDSQVWRSLINGNTTVPGSDPRWWEPSDPPAIPDKLRNPLRALRPQVAAANNVAQLRDALLAVLDTLTGDV